MINLLHLYYGIIFSFVPPITNSESSLTCVFNFSLKQKQGGPLMLKFSM